MIITKTKRQQKEHLIYKTIGFYSNEELQECEKEVQEKHREECEEVHEDFFELSDTQVMDTINDDLNIFYDDEKQLINKELDGKIICIATLGLWNGKKTGFKIMGYNLNEVLTSHGCDDFKVYTDNHNIKAVAHHHDGTNTYLYREIRNMDNIDNLCNKIYNQENITNSMLNYYTKPLGHEIQKIYGY